ncbi:MAG: PAS domain S-box protein [Anaerolineae bacterium]
MSSFIQKILTPPSFEDDADKTRTASVLHKLLISAIVFLMVLEGVVALLVFPEKLYFLIGLPGLALALSIAYWVMQRGQVQLASVLFIIMLWVPFTLFLPFAGGVRSAVIVFYVAGAVVTALLLGTRAALIHISACGLAGLGMAILASSPYAPPQLFMIPSHVGWMAMMLSLALSIAGVNLVMQRRDAALTSLREKTEELDRYFTLGLDLLCIADTGGHFIRLNPEWEKTLGYPLVELEGRRFLDFVHPDDVDSTLAAISQLEQQHEVLNFENRYRCKDGSYRWIEWRSSPQGKLIYAAARDVTDRKQAEQALEESEARYRSLFVNSQAVMMIFDRKDGTIIDVNPAACAYYGLPRDEFVKRHIHDIDSSTPEEISREVEAAGREGRPYFLFKHRRADGETRNVEVYSGPIHVAGRTVSFAIIHDITERRLAEEALRRSEALYRRAIEVIGAVPYYLEYASNAYGFIGEGVYPLTGYTPAEMTPGLWESLVQKSIMLDRASGLERDGAMRLAREGQLDVWKSDDLIRTRDGQTRWVMDAAVEIPEEGGGRPRSSLGILVDITERKQTEQALREMNQRLEETLTELRDTQKQMMHQERLAAVGQLAAGIAHDFNNILASIVLYTQMSLRAELPLQIRQRLEVIAQQTNRAADLVQQVLDFGRRAVLERQPLMLDSFLKEVVKLLQRTLPENVQIDLTSDSGEHLILADPTRIQQVVVNLALNARDAMPNGGEIHISLTRISGQRINCIDCGPIFGGEWVEIAVADTGFGIPPEALPHIFEPFFTTRAPLGHGLGLAQVYGIVNQHNGHIAVETQAGEEGTTFRLYWPALQPTPSQPPVPPSSTIAQGQGETILVVEDDAIVRAALTDALDVLGYNVLEAANGEEALTMHAARAGDVALVLSDWVMPAMGGLELVRALQERAPTLRVLMLTGHPLSQETRETVPPNVVGWTLKPPNLQQLAHDVRKALNRKRGKSTP